MSSRDAALSTVLARAQDQIESGIRELVAGRAAEAEVWIRAARASLAILAAGAPEPLRKMAVVIGPTREAEDKPPEVIEYEEYPLPGWMTKTHGGEK